MWHVVSVFIDVVIWFNTRNTSLNKRSLTIKLLTKSLLKTTSLTGFIINISSNVLTSIQNIFVVSWSFAFEFGMLPKTERLLLKSIFIFIVNKIVNPAPLREILYLVVRMLLRAIQAILPLIIAELQSSFYWVRVICMIHILGFSPIWHYFIGCQLLSIPQPIDNLYDNTAVFPE